MSAMKAFQQSMTHPSEIIALIKFKLNTPRQPIYALQKPNIKHQSQSYTHDLCIYFLNLTSRSFARVIQELDNELKLPICLFYLILRGLGTYDTPKLMNINHLN